MTGVLRAGSLCSDARLLEPDPDRRLGWRVLGDTTEGAILVAAAKAGIDLAVEEKSAPRVLTFPFDADRKLMSTVHQADQDGYEAYVKGSPQALLERCVRISWDASELPLDDALRERVAAANDQLAAQGLRVLAVARRSVDPRSSGRRPRSRAGSPCSA